jgi:hypothetical protein
MRVSDSSRTLDAAGSLTIVFPFRPHPTAFLEERGLHYDSQVA